MKVGTGTPLGFGKAEAGICTLQLQPLIILLTVGIKSLQRWAGQSSDSKTVTANHCHRV